MSQAKPKSESSVAHEDHLAADAGHTHVHGPDCQHDHHHDHGHMHAVSEPFRREEPKIGRNEPCHCGSGKKFKKCHGV